MSGASGFTTGALARRFGCREWQVRRLFERGILPEPPRVGCYRFVPSENVPAVEAALLRARYLPGRPEVSSAD
jgi:hypothetical protein